MTNTLNKIMHNGDEYIIPEYSAGSNVQISSSNVISATDTTYSAGTGLSLTWTTFSNTWVTSFNGNTWTVTYTAPAETVVSGDSWTTYTVKVANSDPTSWTPATTITFVV